MDERLRVEWLNLGVVDYEDAGELQVRLSRDLSNQSNLSGYLLFLEHPPTITLGYSIKENDTKNCLRVSEEFLRSRGVKIFHTDRGGKATFHGPGQLVMYPILNLNRFGISSRFYVHKLEQVVINWLMSKGLPAERNPDYPGVWVHGKKIASVGVRIENRISRHGIALNLWTDLNYFDLIVPCGIKDCQIVSYFQLTGKRVKMKETIQELLKEFEIEFGMSLNEKDDYAKRVEGGTNDDQGMADARVV